MFYRKFQIVTIKESVFGGLINSTSYNIKTKSLMKKGIKINYLLTLCILFVSVVFTNCSPDDDDGIPRVGNIPDPAFEQALIDLGYDDVLDGSIITANIASVLELTLKEDDFNNTDNDIKDLTGIEYFTSLTKLDCRGLNLTSLNLSNNLNLKELNCGYSKFQSLSSLIVNKNIALEILYCHGNDLSNLDVSNNINLKELYVYDNQLTNLDVGNNTDLKIIWCYGNPLSNLDVSNNANLEVLDCRFMDLTSLDVSNNVNLKRLSLWDNQISTIDVSNNLTLESLE